MSDPRPRRVHVRCSRCDRVNGYILDELLEVGEQLCVQCENGEDPYFVKADIEDAFRAGVEAMRNGSLEFMRCIGVRFDDKIEDAIMSIDADDLLQREEWAEYAYPSPPEGE